MRIIKVIAVAALALAACSSPKDVAEKVQSSLQTTTPAGDKVVITQAEFLKIHEGLDIQAVEDIVGGPGKLVSQTAVTGIGEWVNYQWGGENVGANAVISFRDSIVYAKTQVGLT